MYYLQVQCIVRPVSVKCIIYLLSGAKGKINLDRGVRIKSSMILYLIILHLGLCILVNFIAFCHHLIFFQYQLFFKNSFRNTVRVSHKLCKGNQQMPLAERVQCSTIRDFANLTNCWKKPT